MCSVIPTDSRTSRRRLIAGFPAIGKHTLWRVCDRIREPLPPHRITETIPDVFLAFFNFFAANLSETNLTDALVFYEQLAVTYLLTDAIMPDGTKNDGRFVTRNEGTEMRFPYPIPYP